MRMTKFLLAAGMTALVSTSGAHAQGRLNMICASSQDVCDAVVNEFGNKTGIDVNMIRLSSGEAYAKIRAEARNPKTDIWFGGTHDPHYQAADEDLILSYKSPSLAGLIPLAQKMAEDTDYKATSFAVGALGFTYNTQMLKEKNLPEPKCWADLLKPDYKGEIALSNPNSAGTGYTTLATLVDLLGEDEAFDYLKKLDPNISAYAKSGTGTATQAGRGEITIAVAMQHVSNIVVRQGFPLQNVSPCEGTGYSLDGVSIIKGAKNLNEAKRFMDWILTAEAQSINIANGLNSYPTARGTTFSEYTVDIEGMKFLDLDPKIYGSPVKRQALLSRWDREIGAIAR